MPNRSQRHVLDVRAFRPPIANILPDTASIAAVGAVGRVVATLSTAGGVPPMTYAITSAGGMQIAINGNQIVTTVNPCGTTGAKTVSIKATDVWGATKTENVTVTVT